MSRTDSSGQDGLRASIAALITDDEKARQKCADTDDCGCAYKDCYECGMWHNCVHSTATTLRNLLAEHPATPTEVPAEVADEDRGDGPECSNCGKTTCPDADLPEFTDPRECEFASMYEAFRATKDCDYGCGRDYSMQAVRLWLAPEMERILAERLAEAESHIEQLTASRDRAEAAEGALERVRVLAEALTVAAKIERLDDHPHVANLLGAVRMDLLAALANPDTKDTP